MYACLIRLLSFLLVGMIFLFVAVAGCGIWLSRFQETPTEHVSKDSALKANIPVPVVDEPRPGMPSERESPPEVRERICAYVLHFEQADSFFWQPRPEVERRLEILNLTVEISDSSPGDIRFETLDFILADTVCEFVFDGETIAFSYRKPSSGSLFFAGSLWTANTPVFSEMTKPQLETVRKNGLKADSGLVLPEKMRVLARGKKSMILSQPNRLLLVKEEQEGWRLVNEWYEPRADGMLLGRITEE